jgi:hypothetical protein
MTKKPTVKSTHKKNTKTSAKLNPRNKKILEIKKNLITQKKAVGALEA